MTDLFRVDRELKPGEYISLQAQTLNILVVAQSTGVSVYIQNQDGECICETWALYSEGDSDAS